MTQTDQKVLLLKRSDLHADSLTRALYQVRMRTWGQALVASSWPNKPEETA